MNAEFEKAKRSIGVEQNKPLELAGKIEVKGLYFFAKGIQLKNQLEQESRGQQ